MAAQVARPHAHLSNRAKTRTALERKPVFKSVLQNPFQVNWPSVPASVQNVLLARLVATLENILLRTHGARKRARPSDVFGQQGHIECAASQSNSEAALVGINAVTRALECQLHTTRKSVISDNRQKNDDQRSPSSAPSPIAIVFVCYGDVDPLALVSHIPYLVAGCNSLKNGTRPVKLVPLPEGSESTIAMTLGVRRAAVLAFRNESPLCEAVRDLLDSVPILSASWLSPPDAHTPRFVPTHIKQLRTTAPKDMKAAREQRSKARAATKKKMSGSRSVHPKPRLTLTTGSDKVLDGSTATRN